MNEQVILVNQIYENKCIIYQHFPLIRPPWLFTVVTIENTERKIAKQIERYIFKFQFMVHINKSNLFYSILEKMVCFKIYPK